MAQVDDHAPKRGWLLAHGGQHASDRSQAGIALQAAGMGIEDQDVQQESVVK
jgi:hypothetical protein